MEAQEMHRTPRDAQFLDTVALGSMLVFASVMPPFDPDEAALAASDDAGEEDRSGLEELCGGHAEWQCHA